MKEFEGKTAVVTGAASGIGLGLAEKFARERMQVVMADVEEDALKESVEKMEQNQYKVIGLCADVLVKKSMEELFAKSKEQYGNIHILCNNAGIGANSGDKAIWEVEKTDWDWSMGVNFYGVLHGLQTFVPHMIEHGQEGHIITTVSLAGLFSCEVDPLPQKTIKTEIDKTAKNNKPFLTIYPLKFIPYFDRDSSF